MKKRLALLMMSLLLVAMTFAGCGKVSHDDISGEWKLTTIGGASVAEYAAQLGYSEVMAMVSWEIGEDDILTSTAVDPETMNSTITQSYEIKRTENGFEVQLPDSENTNEIFFYVTYEKEKDTLSYTFQLGTETVEYVFEKGGYDFTAGLEAAKAEEKSDLTGEQQDEADDPKEDVSGNLKPEAEPAVDGEDADEPEDPGETNEPMEVTVENLHTLLTEHTWKDENGVEVTFYDDATSYVIMADGSRTEAEWQVMQMEDGSVALINYIDGNENIQTVVSCGSRKIVCDDGTVYQYVEE